MCAKSTETTELAAIWFEPRHQRLVRIGPSRAVRDCEDQTYAGVDYIGNHVVTSRRRRWHRHGAGSRQRTDPGRPLPYSDATVFLALRPPK